MILKPNLLLPTQNNIDPVYCIQKLLRDYTKS